MTGGGVVASSNDITVVDDYLKITDSESTSHIPPSCGSALTVDWTGETVKIKMNNLEISSVGYLIESTDPYDPSKYVEMYIECDAIIEISGTNKVTLKDDTSHANYSGCGIRCEGELTITGDGVLNVETINTTTGPRYGCQWGIYSNGFVVKERAKVNSTGGEVKTQDSTSIGVQSESVNVINNATLTAKGGKATGDWTYSFGIYCDTIEISYATLNTDSSESGTDSSGISLESATINHSNTYITGYKSALCSLEAAEYRPTCNDCIGIFVSETHNDPNPTTPLEPATEMGKIKTYKTTALNNIHVGADATTSQIPNYGTALDVTWKDGTATIKMNNLDIESAGYNIPSGGQYDPAQYIEIYIECDAVIEVSGVNYVTLLDDTLHADTACFGILSKGKLTIVGDGELNVKTINKQSASSFFTGQTGIKAEDDFVVEDKATVNITAGEIIATSDNGITSCGLWALKNINVSDNATLNAKGGKADSGTSSYTYSYGIDCDAVIEVSDATLNAVASEAKTHSYGVFLNDKCTINIVHSNTYFTGAHAAFLYRYEYAYCPISSGCIDVKGSTDYNDQNPSIPITPETEMNTIKTFKTTADFADHPVSSDVPMLPIVSLIIALFVVAFALVVYSVKKQ